MMPAMLTVPPDWARFRDDWNRANLLRTVAAFFAFALAALALAMRGRPRP